jgi:nucleotide-binding universal stress UspA family protein
MAYAQILLCANGPGLIDSKLQVAVQLARRFHSHLSVTFFREVMLPAQAERRSECSDDPQAALVQAAWDQEAEGLSRARIAYDRWSAHTTPDDAAAPGMTTSWSEPAGLIAALFPSLARACDINVVGGPAGGDAGSSLDDPVSSMALLSSGRLTLFAPRPQHLADDLLRHVVIAWDDSAAVARTIAQAMPLIMAAGSVTLLVAETSPDRVTPCNGMLSYLRASGMQPEVVRMTPILHTLRETLSSETRRLGASLLVMGAYKHNRIRQILLGGVTRHMIQRADCTIAMTC